MNEESLNAPKWKELSLGEVATREFLQTKLGCIPDDLESPIDGSPVICVIEDRLRLPSVFKRGETKLGPPSFVIFFGATDISLFTRPNIWLPEYGDTVEMRNLGQAVFCAITPEGEINIWRSEQDRRPGNRPYNMSSTVFFKPPDSATAHPDSVARWQELLARIGQQANLIKK